MKRDQQSERGQAMIEMAIILSLLLLLVSGIMDFGMMLSTRIAIINAARNGARYATVYPAGWSSSASAPAASIEGVIQDSGGPASIPNDDQHIMITYLRPDGTTCGYYSTAGFQGTQSSCVVPGNLIQVTVTYTYRLMTPMIRQLFPSGVTLSSTATMVEEQ